MSLPGVRFQDGLSWSKPEQLQPGFESCMSPPHGLHQRWCLFDSTGSWTNRAVLRFFWSSFCLLCSSSVWDQTSILVGTGKGSSWGRRDCGSPSLHRIRLSWNHGYIWRRHMSISGWFEGTIPPGRRRGVAIVISPSRTADPERTFDYSKK